METLLREEFGKFEFPSRAKSHCFAVDRFCPYMGKFVDVKDLVPVYLSVNVYNCSYFLQEMSRLFLKLHVLYGIVLHSRMN